MKHFQYSVRPNTIWQIVVDIRLETEYQYSYWVGVAEYYQYSYSVGVTEYYQFSSGFHPGVLGSPRGAYLISWIIIRRMIFEVRRAAYVSHLDVDSVASVVSLSLLGGCSCKY